MSSTRPTRLAATVPILASALVVSTVGGARTNEPARDGPKAADVTASNRRAVDPCERRWPPRAARSDADARGVARPAPSGAGPSRRRAASGRPNIVMIMVDDMRADELRGPWMKHTRTLIAERGASFVNSFAPFPLCGPARASFLTGKYSHNHRIRRNTAAFDKLDETNTLATWLDRERARSDYNTVYLGKYINGYNAPGYVPPGWDQWYASLGKSTQQSRSTVLSDNGRGVIELEGQFQTTAYGDRAESLVSELSGRRKPFFLTLSFSAPHAGGPREPDDPPDLGTPARLVKNHHLYEDRIVRPKGVRGEPCNRRKPDPVSDLTRIRPGMQRQVVELRQQRAQSLKTVDTQVRKLMRALRRTGELSNTYVLFTSDNGFYLGEFRQRFGKRLAYEPALRTPTLVRGPGIAHGAQPRAPFTSIDFAPTIAAMANVRTRGRVDGKSMLKAAKAGRATWRRAILTEAGHYGGKDLFGRGVRARGLSYGRYRDPQVRAQLFDLPADPHQNRNVIDRPKYRKRARQMRRAYRALRDCHGRECRQVRP